jgi:hypothetical protein
MDWVYWKQRAYKAEKDRDEFMDRLDKTLALVKRLERQIEIWERTMNEELRNIPLALWKPLGGGSEESSQ